MHGKRDLEDVTGVRILDGKSILASPGGLNAITRGLEDGGRRVRVREDVRTEAEVGAAGSCQELRNGGSLWKVEEAGRNSPLGPLEGRQLCHLLV